VETTSLSIVIPAFNEAPHLPGTVAALAAALDGSGFDAELVVVDDGSADGSGEVARDAVAGRLPVSVVRQRNMGRFVARRRGLEAADGRFVLFLDARVRLDRDALRFVRTRIEDGELVWNAHVHVRGGGRFATFWRLLAELAWREYFDDPRTTHFGVEDFDRYPKGTTCFFAPRTLLASAFGGFETRYGDMRLANDDTPILRALAAQEPIGISPRFACEYAPRETIDSFVRHAFHRGVVFVDGHGTRESRFFWPTVAFFPLSAAMLAAAWRRPAVPAATLAAAGICAGAYGTRARRSFDEVATLALVTPLYAAAHGAGMWRGLAELVRSRIGSVCRENAAARAWTDANDSAVESTGPNGPVTKKPGSDPGFEK
jgi:glycosyltransferase involved in cell wall biosynthesis